jgi:hypothetical protein
VFKGVICVLIVCAVFPAASAVSKDAERIAYADLVSGIDTYRGATYAATSVPIRFFDIPRNFSYQTAPSDKVLMMTDRTGGERVFLIVSQDMVSSFKSNMVSNKEIDYLYTPLGIYNKFPLLRLVSITGE